MVKINRNYKDRLFRMVFCDKHDLLELYDAMNGSAYGNPDDLEITTAEASLYMGMKNDAAFIIDDVLSLWEHQSSWKPKLSPCIELKATVININRSHREELMLHCRKLKDYSEFAARIRDGLKSGFSLEDAVQHAVSSCIRAMILDNLEESVPAERIIQKLQRFFGLDDEGASDLLLACTEGPHGGEENKNSA